MTVLDRDPHPAAATRAAVLRAALPHDLPASFVVFLVAVPLSLGIALASSAPVTAGLVAAVVGGIVAGALGGSRLQVSGPAAGLTVIVASLVHQYGWAVTCAITVGAGALQVLLGMSRVARAALAISPAVVHGMLAGIGIVIALTQVHVVLGGTPQADVTQNVLALPGHLLAPDPAALGLGVMTAAVLLLWPRLPAAVRRVPGHLVAVVAGTATAWAAGLDVPRVAVPEDLLGEHVLPALPDDGWRGIALGVVTVALIASIESLLSAVAVDRMHDGPRADLDRELVGQGVANMASGSLGGLPVTGVIVRSSTNVAAGATTRASAVLHGVWVLAFVVVGADLLRQIPTAVLAALLVMIGLKLLDVQGLRQLHRHRELPLFLVTVVGVVELNLMEGVVLGVAAAVLVGLFRLSACRVHVDQADDGHWSVLVKGAMTFLAVPRLARALARVPAGAHVHVELAADLIDHAAFEAFDTWRRGHERRGGTVEVHETHDQVYARAAEDGAGGRRTVPARPRYLPWAEDGGTALDKVVAGVTAYEQDLAPQVRPVFRRLSTGQSPTHLFITCSDSRVVPDLITSSGPGDLFVVRNVGNLVPRWSDLAPDASSDASVAAAVEYAVSVLGVSSITVCGHSGCGAMGALLDGHGEGRAETMLDRWLEHGRHTLARFRVEDPVAGDDQDSAHARLCEVNVVQQLDNLLTHPVVRTAVDRGDLSLVALHFDIASAEVRIFDRTWRSFVPVTAETGGPAVSGARDAAALRVAAISGRSRPAPA